MFDGLLTVTSAMWYVSESALYLAFGLGFEFIHCFSPYKSNTGLADFRRRLLL